MKEFDYDYLKKLVGKYLWKTHHDRHLEDCIQFCALAYFEGRTNIQWTVIDYCRQNGIGERGKGSAIPLEKATFVGLSSDESEDVNENGYLLENFAHEKYIEEQQEDEDKECRVTFAGRLEEFLLPINLSNEVFQWVKRIYRPKQYKINARTFNI